jgi:hypothetical protein
VVVLLGVISVPAPLEAHLATCFRAGSMALDDFFDPLRSLTIRLVASTLVGRALLMWGWWRERRPRPAGAASGDGIEWMRRWLRNPIDLMRWILLVGLLATYAIAAGVLGPALGGLGPGVEGGGALVHVLYAHLLAIVVLVLWAQTVAAGPGAGQFPPRWVPGAAALVVFSGLVLLVVCAVATLTGWPDPTPANSLRSFGTGQVARGLRLLPAGVFSLLAALLAAGCMRAFAWMGRVRAADLTGAEPGQGRSISRS